MMETKTAFEILGIAPGTPAKEIKQAYKDLVLIMFLGIKGTWHEYGTIVKTLKNISAYSMPIRNPR